MEVQNVISITRWAYVSRGSFILAMTHIQMPRNQTVNQYNVDWEIVIKDNVTDHQVGTLNKSNE